MSTYGCARCTNRWGGLRTAHCGACHLTFTALSTFDKHRRDGHCADPEAVGLVRTTRDYPCWGMPGDDSRWPNDATDESQSDFPPLPGVTTPEAGNAA